MKSSRDGAPPLPTSIARAVIGLAISTLLTPALLFAAAGTLAWPGAWVYTGLLIAAVVGSRLVVWRRHPDLLRERARFAERDGGAAAWDRPLVAIVGVLGPAVTAVVAGLDHRYGWSPDMSAAGQAVGALLVAAGFALAVWAMVVNRFFSAVVRIQRDRGHVVVTGGPYRLVRHPAYAGSLLAAVGQPLLLSALWAIVPLALTTLALVERTRREDALLLAELAGYPAYAARTRYRLLPRVW